MKQFYVYTHEDPEGRVFYVGKGYGRRAYDLNTRGGRHLHKLRKLGGEGVVIRVYTVADERHALTIEMQLIALMRKAGIDLCNITNGGSGITGLSRTPEHREKLRLALLGHSVSDETRRKIGEAGCGRVPSEKTREKYRAKRLADDHRAALLKAITGRVVSEEAKAKSRAAMLGRKLSDEHRRKLSESHKGKKQSPELVAKRAAAVRAACVARREKRGVDNA